MINATNLYCIDYSEFRTFLKGDVSSLTEGTKMTSRKKIIGLR